MSDLPEPPVPDLAPAAGAVPGGPAPAAGDLEVDLAAFLPEGTTLGPTEPPVDLAALTRIEADLAAVDDALLALDAGDPGRSPLLTELLAAPAPPPG